MINIETYILQLANLLQAHFGTRLQYIGLQGSYMRGEATENSDIDIMVVIDELSVDDLDYYRSVIDSLGEPDKSCGFICSKTDLSNWNPLEICNLLHGTKDYYGTLSKIVPPYSSEDIRNFLKFSLNSLYHEICHRYIHGDPSKNAAKLPYTYKGVFFILQNLHYLRSGEFINNKVRLLSLLQGMDQAVLSRSMMSANEISRLFRESFELLFTWCQQTLRDL